MFRKMWNSFADMSSNDARRKFIETLDKSVSVFAPFMAAHQKEKEEHERFVRYCAVTTLFWVFKY